MALIALSLEWQRDVRKLLAFLRAAPVPISAAFFHGLNESLVWVQARYRTGWAGRLIHIYI